MDKEKLLEFLMENEKLLNILRCNPTVEKTALAKKMDISFPTLVKQLEELKKQGILINDNKMEVDANAFFLCGISIGGAQCKVTFIDAKYNVLSGERFNEICDKYGVLQQTFFESTDGKNNNYGYRYFHTPDNETDLKLNLNAIIKDIIKMYNIAVTEKEVPVILGIGIAITGSIDAKQQIVISSHNVEYMTNMSKEMLISPDVLQMLREKGILFVIDHNAKALAVCEKFSLYQQNNINGEYSRKKNIASFYLGSGIGCGLILDNTLVRGCRNLNGELGHIQVPRYKDNCRDIDDDSRCSCGAKACLEHYIIRDVFQMSKEEFKRISSNDIKSYLNNLPEDIKEKKLRMLGYYIGWAIDMIVKLLNVDLIIFSGKMTCFMNELWQYITPVAGNIDYAMLDCSMIISKYAALAPAIGAGILSSYPANYSITWYD